MSLPVDIPRRAPRSALTSSSSSSVSSASTSPITTPSSSLGLYVPIHKRTSRTSHGPQAAAHPSIYTVDFLLSLRPTADESIRNKLRTSHPELLMSRRIRKSLEFHDRQRIIHHDLPASGTPTTHDHIDVGLHRVPTLSMPPQKQLHVPSVTPHLAGRVLPRRSSRAAFLPAERRRQAWQPVQASAGTWRGLEQSSRRSHAVSV